MIPAGHIIAIVIVVRIWLLLSSKFLTFVKYSYEGSKLNGFKFASYAIKVIIIGAMLFGMYPHFLLLSEFIQDTLMHGSTIFEKCDAIITTNYMPFGIELLWLIGLYFGATLLEAAIAFGIIFPMVRLKLSNY